MNPYEVLNVRKNASAATIKAAYRRLAKAVHPDAGGTAEAFDRLNAAYQTLSDPAARAHYDKTGEIHSKAPDNELSEVIGMVTGALTAAISELLQNGTEPKNSDLIAEMLRYVDGQVAKMRKQREDLTAGRPKWDDLRSRFSAKDDGPNYLDGIVRAKLSEIDQSLAALERRVELAAKARAVIADHKFRADGQPRQTFYFTTLGGGANSTSTMG